MGTVTAMGAMTADGTASAVVANASRVEHQEYPRLTDDEKKRFDVQTTIQALKIPKQQSGKCMKVLHDLLYKRPGVKRIEHCDEEDKRLVLLGEDFTQASLNDSTVQVNVDGAHKSLAEYIKENNFEVAQFTITQGYKDMSLQEVLKQYLPEDVEIPSSFEAVGHIAHLNLKEGVLRYKYIIGQVILDKNPSIKTVVNKLGTITSEYRVFDMEVLAGEDVTETVVKQHGLRFKLDFRHVYWNSRLENEHSRLVDTWLKPTDVVVDAMCGIGPFAVPAAKKGCRVFANDLNPESHRWLVENCRLNQVQDKVQCFNEDARAFLRRAAGGGLHGVDDRKDVDSTAPVLFDHIIMNLPATAVEFLDALKGEFNEQLWKDKELPMVHVYSFLQETQTFEEMQRLIESHLGGALDTAPDFFLVRDVAPKKAMICSSFRVPRGVALDRDGPEGREEKRPKY